MATTNKTLAEGMSTAVEAVKSWPQRVKAYIEGLRMEMRRVTWPNRKQVRATTIVVIITVFVFAAYFAAVDATLGWGMNRLLQYFAR